jgi:hypothetical protein
MMALQEPTCPNFQSLCAISEEKIARAQATMAATAGGSVATPGLAETRRLVG